MPRPAFAAPRLALALLLLATGCAEWRRQASAPGTPATGTAATEAAERVSPPFAHDEQARFWEALQALCGRAFEGRLVQGNASDSAFTTNRLVMHVRECRPGEIRIPFHLGEDRSRTWIVTRTATGLRLKHDHRHADGTEDAVTQYGGDTRGAGRAAAQEFHADAHTASLIPAAATNVWTMAIEPGRTFAYALRREGTDRRFRVEFDLTRPVAAPPAPWGHPD